MTDTLTALTERRAQINLQRLHMKSQIIENNGKFEKARFYDHASTDELKAIAAQGDELEKQLADIESELASVDNAIRDEQARIKDEKRKADEQARLEKDRQKQEQAKAQWTVAESKLMRKKDAEKIIDALKVQIMPSNECVEPNDKFVKTLFRLGLNFYKKTLQGGKYKVKEKKQTAKKDAVFSQISIQNAEGYEDDTPLDEFDRAVLGILISEYLSGNRYTTVNIIFRALIGNVGEIGIHPQKNQQDAIVSSVMKLMGTIVDFRKIAESLQELNYTDQDGNEVKLKVSNLLSADLVDAKINGQDMEGVIFFKDNSPLFKVADAKSQVIRYPHELLDVPNQNNTPRIISIKKYVMRRICEIKLHKQLTPTITFDDVFKRCRMQNCPRKVKMDARNAITKLFDHLQGNNFISSFEPVQQRGKFVSIKFTF